MKPRVYLTRDMSRLVPEALSRLREECEAEVFPEDRRIGRSELLEKVQEKEGILVLATDRIDEEVIRAGTRLRVIASWSAGCDHIDVSAATRSGVYVSNAPSVELGVSVAEAAWGLLLAITRKIVQGDKDVRAGRYKGWEPFDYLGNQLNGKTLGIIGLGKAGREVAQRAKCWGVRVLYTDEVAVDPDTERQLGVEKTTLHALLQQSDFVTLHVPLIPGKTHHLLGSQELALMKPSAYLVNTSRGAVVDEVALVRFLREKRIAGAALDVYENEPQLTEGLAELDNVVLTPHLAGHGLEGTSDCAVVALHNLLVGVRGQRPPNAINEVNNA